MISFLGIDVGKGDFHASLLMGDRTSSKSFSNNKSGLSQLSSWLKNRKVEDVHACRKSTGGFEEALALDLHERGHVVSVTNPSRIKASAQSELLCTKPTQLMLLGSLLSARRIGLTHGYRLRRKPVRCKRLCVVTRASKTCSRLKPIGLELLGWTLPLSVLCVNT